jgi:hypothetical protein
MPLPVSRGRHASRKAPDLMWYARGRSTERAAGTTHVKSRAFRD